MFRWTTTPARRCETIQSKSPFYRPPHSTLFTLTRTPVFLCLRTMKPCHHCCATDSIDCVAHQRFAFQNHEILCSHAHLGHCQCSRRTTTIVLLFRRFLPLLINRKDLTRSCNHCVDIFCIFNRVVT